MISLGERLAIVMPSIFFNILILINTIELSKAMIEIMIQAPISEDREEETIFGETLVRNTMQLSSSGYLIEFIILSITNGLTSIFILEENILGIGFILIGVIISIIGFSYINLESTTYSLIDNKLHFKYTEKITNICIALSIGQLGFFISFGVSPLFNINQLHYHWVVGILFSVVGYIYAKWGIDRLMPPLPREKEDDAESSN